MDRDVESMRFGGPVEKLAFRAERSDINCRAIRATFDNGRTQQVYSGQLRQGQDVTVDLPGNARNIRNLQFACGAEMQRGGVIQISADVGSYQDAWRNNPDFNRLWAQMFSWANNGQGRGFPGRGPGMGPGRGQERWEPLSNARFQDTEVSFASWRGRSVSAIALMPVENDARCSRVAITFQNGRTAAIAANGGNIMRRGQTYPLDLPGGDRNIRDLRMQCTSEGSSNVTVRVLAAR
jgi:hypothetical protein